MTSIKISNLPQASTLNNTDYITVIQGGVNKRVDLSILFANIKSNIIINPDGGAIDAIIHGQNIDNLFKTYSTLNRVGIGMGINTPDALLHINGDVKINGNIKTSFEILNITTDSETTTQVISTSTSSTAIKAIEGSKTTNLTLLLGVPPGDGIIKTIVYNEKHSSVANTVQYQLSTSNIVGVTNIIFNKLGGSVILYGQGSKWSLIGYNGVSIV